MMGKKRLTQHALMNLIDEFADLKGENLDISGGLEPLLSPYVLNVLKKGLKRKLKISLYTNGIALNNNELVNYLLKIYQIRVSFNAYDRKSYKEIMGVDKFDVVKENIELMMKARKETDSRVRIGIGFVLYKDNYLKIFDVIKLAQELKVDFLDIRSVHVTSVADFSEKQKEELIFIIKKIRLGILSKKYGMLDISISDTFDFINSDNTFFNYLRKDFINDLAYFRFTVSPQGYIYALNVIAQPGREDSRYLLGEYKKNHLSSILSKKINIPFEPEMLLPHDISILTALFKLKSDLEFGITLTENPFNFSPILQCPL